jgi:cytochrome P450
VDIYDPEFYVSGNVHEVFAELRRTDPVHWQDIPGEEGYWAVLRHQDIVTVSRNPETFSSALGGIMVETSSQERLEQSRRMMLLMDPPQHMQYRRPLAPHFGPNVLLRMEAQIRELTRTILAEVLERGDVDFVKDVAGPLPAQVMAQVMGLPQADTAKLRLWAEVQLGSQDDDVAVDTYDAGSAGVEMAMYAIGLATERRPLPRTDDVFALLLDTQFEDGRPMDDVSLGEFFVQLVTAGNDTTKTMIAAGADQLIRHPDQLRRLRDDRSLVPGAVEEMLRYCNPVHYMRHTAVHDVELGGRQLRAGDKVAMIYTSANRDEAVFADPQVFDIGRSPNPHLSFGIGGHFCLGVHLARLEARVFFEELLDVVGSIESTAEPARIRSNFNNGFKRMPVRLAPRR